MRANDNAATLARPKLAPISMQPERPSPPASAPTSSRVLACICSSVSKAIISPSSACRCCHCWHFCAASGCSRYERSERLCKSCMIILGLTGSIGMGKSTTAKLFAEAGVPVYDADATVHMIYEGEAAPAIEAAFPGTTADGKVDRARLVGASGARSGRDASGSSRSFIRCCGAYHQKFLDDAEQSGAPVAVVDVPLLFETGGEKRVDAVVVAATAPHHVQRERVLARPGG